jgi:hypothetical protein
MFTQSKFCKVLDRIPYFFIVLLSIRSLTIRRETAKILVRQSHRLRVEASFLPGDIMESALPAMERDFPEVVNLNNAQVDSVQAELVRANSSQIKQLSAQEVDIRDSFSFVVNADTINARKSIIGHVASGNLTLLESNVIAAQTNSLDLKGRAGVVAADSAHIDNGYAGLLVSRDVQGENIRTGLLISRNVTGNVETLLDTRSTVLVGVVAGAIVGSILMVGQLLFRRK